MPEKIILPGWCWAATPCCSHRATGCRPVGIQEVGLQVENELFIVCVSTVLINYNNSGAVFIMLENLIIIHTNWC